MFRQKHSAAMNLHQLESLQCDRDRVIIRASGIVGEAEDDLNYIRVYLDSSYKCSDNLPFTVPVSIGQIVTNGC
jgi:hypothetical protein